MYFPVYLLLNGSYIILDSTCFRYEPSTADVDTYSAVKAPQANTPNLLRWYNHIKSFTDKERTQFPKKKSDFSTAPASAPKPADDDDDVDLFGSDDEDVCLLHFFFLNLIIPDILPISLLMFRFECNTQ